MKSRHISWRRIFGVMIIILEIIATFVVFLKMQETSKDLLLEVKQQVVETEGLSVNADEILVYRLNGNRYVFYLHDKKSKSYIIDSKSIKKNLDDYIKKQSDKKFLIFMIILSVSLADVIILKNLLK